MKADTGLIRGIERVAQWSRKRIPADSSLRPLLRALRDWLPRPAIAPEQIIPSVIAEFAHRHPKAFFVQIGANDATHNDPLNSAIRSADWRGILVEPVPCVFARLKQKDAGDARLALENVAISDHDDQQELHYLRQAGDEEQLPVLCDQLGSFRKDVVLSHRHESPGLEKFLVSEHVDCLTFDSLRRRHGVSRIDLLHIDTERYGVEVIKRVDLELYRPILILFEHFHLSAEEIAAAHAHLYAHGYELMPVGTGTLCLSRRSHRKLRRLWRRLPRTHLSAPSPCEQT